MSPRSLGWCSSLPKQREKPRLSRSHQGPGPGPVTAAACTDLDHTHPQNTLDLASVSGMGDTLGQPSMALATSTRCQVKLVSLTYTPRQFEYLWSQTWNRWKSFCSRLCTTLYPKVHACRCTSVQLLESCPLSGNRPCGAPTFYARTATCMSCPCCQPSCTSTRAVVGTL
jgi:hypothetical protein